jgi:hypothetical protein
MLPLLRRVLDAENDDLSNNRVHHVVDQIGVAPCHELADALSLLESADLRKQDEVL